MMFDYLPVLFLHKSPVFQPSAPISMPMYLYMYVIKNMDEAGNLVFLTSKSFLINTPL